MKNILKYSFFLFSIVLFALSSCQYDKYKAPTEQPANVSFQKDLIPIFNQSCNMSGCHATGSISPDLSSANAYSSLTTGDLLDLKTPEMSELYLRMTDQKNPMPPGGILSTTQTNKVLEWIKEGAKNN